MKESMKDTILRLEAENRLLTSGGLKSPMLAEDATEAARLAAAVEALAGEVRRLNERMESARKKASALPVEAGLLLFMSHSKECGSGNRDAMKANAARLAAEYESNFGMPPDQDADFAAMLAADRARQRRKWFGESVTLCVRLCAIPYSEDPDERKGFEQAFVARLREYSGQPKKDGAA